MAMRGGAVWQLVRLIGLCTLPRKALGGVPRGRYHSYGRLRTDGPAFDRWNESMANEVPADVADRRYERWVMRAAELVWGDYPDDREDAERVLLERMQDSFVG